MSTSIYINLHVMSLNFEFINHLEPDFHRISHRISHENHRISHENLHFSGLSSYDLLRWSLMAWNLSSPCAR